MAVRILSVGELRTEEFLVHSGEARVGEEVAIDTARRSVGGTAVNTAVTFARAGLAASVAGAVGDDIGGAEAQDFLDREGVGRDALTYLSEVQTSSLVSVGSLRGARTNFIFRGAGSDYSGLVWSDLAATRPNWVFLGSLDGDWEKIFEVIDGASSDGVKIAWAPGKSEVKNKSRVRALLDRVDWLVVNRTAAEAIFGAADTLDQLVFRALNITKGVAITNSKKGSIASDGETVAQAGLFAPVRELSKAGVDDAYAAGLISQIALGKTVREAVQFASVNAAAVIANFGPNAGALDFGADTSGLAVKETRLR